MSLFNSLKNHLSQTSPFFKYTYVSLQCGTTKFYNKRSISTSPAIEATSNTVDVLFYPPQLAISLFEQVHFLTALPWWFTIPATALTLKTMLLPFTLRAKQSSASISLLHYSFLKAHEVTQFAQKTNTSIFDVSAVPQLGRFSMMHRIYHYLHWKHNIPAFKWYLLNSTLQGGVLASITLGLADMSEKVWPGFTTEGLPGLTDLTNASIYLSTLSTPFGVAGAILPLFVVLSYGKALDKASSALVPGVSMAMRLLGIPLYLLLLAQPQAVLLSWAAWQGAHHATQVLLSRPRLQAACHIQPELMPNSDANLDQRFDVMRDPLFLSSLAESCAASRSEGSMVGIGVAKALLQHAHTLMPHDLRIARDLAYLHTFQLEWDKAAALIVGCVPHVPADADKADLYMEAANMLVEGAKIAGHSNNRRTRKEMQVLLGPVYSHITVVERLSPGHPWVQYCYSRAAGVLGDLEESETLARRCAAALTHSDGPDADPAHVSISDKLAEHLVYLGYKYRTRAEMGPALRLATEATALARRGETLRRARMLAVEVGDAEEALQEAKDEAGKQREAEAP